MAELPDWLKSDAEQPSFQTTVVSPSPFVVSPSTGTDRHVVTTMTSSSLFSSSAASPPASPFLVEDDGKPPPRQHSWLQKIGAGLVHAISFVFFALLVYAVITQVNDASEAFLWILYYGANAALVVLFVLTRLFGMDRDRLGRILLILSILMLGFTGIMLWFSIQDYQDASSKHSGGDDDKKNEKEETFIEVCGAAFGGLSVLYHLVVWKCTSGKRNEKNNNPVEDDHDI